MSVQTEPCARCDTPVTRVVLDDANPLAELMSKMPSVCDKCIAALDEQDDAERQREKAAQERSERIADRLKRSGMPRRHMMTLDQLDHPSDVLDAARGWVTDGGGLMLTGKIGRGKTMIAGAACWERLQHRLVIWASTPLLFARLGSGFQSEQRDWALEVLSAKHALVLDDIDKARPTEYGAEQVFLAIDQRVEHEAPLLVTTNLSSRQLAKKWPEPYGPAIASRLVGYCRVVRVEGSDRRLSAPFPPRILGSGTGQ